MMSNDSDPAIMQEREPTDGTASEEDRLGGRLRLLPPSELSPSQRALYDYIASSIFVWAKFSGRLPDGRLIGPFNVFLYAPEMAQAFNTWVDTERAATSLSAEVREVVILTVGAAWGAAYEIYAHTIVGKQAGLTEATIQSIVAGREPDTLSADARAAYRFTSSLVTTKAVEEPLFAETVELLQARGVVELVNLVGAYLAISALLNAFRIPVPRQ